MGTEIHRDNRNRLPFSDDFIGASSSCSKSKKNSVDFISASSSLEINDLTSDGKLGSEGCFLMNPKSEKENDSRGSG